MILFQIICWILALLCFLGAAVRGYFTNPPTTKLELVALGLFLWLLPVTVALIAQHS
jgi:hypothetical protein